MPLSKATRTGLFIVGGLVVLVVVGLLIAILTVDPAKLASSLSKRVLEDTGRELHIDGDASVSFFPWLGVTMENVRLTNPDSFGSGNFFTVKRMEFRARLLPLLKNRFIVDAVVLDGLTLNLVQGEQGERNWDFLQGVPQTEGQAGAQEAPESADAQEEGKPLFLDVASVDVTDASINYVNLATNSSVATSGVKLSLSEIRQQDHALGTDFSLSGKVTTTAPDMSGTYDVSSKVVMDHGSGRVFLKGFEFEFTGEGNALPGGKADLKVAADINLDTSTRGVVFDNAVFSAYGASVNGNFRFMPPGKEGGIAGDLALSQCNPRKVLAALGISVPAMKDSGAFTKLSARWRLESSFNGLNIPAMEIHLDDSQITGSLSAKAQKDSAPPSLSGRLQIDSLDVDRYTPAPSGKAAPATAKKSSGGAATPADAKTMPNVDLLLSMGKLKAGGATLSNLTLTVKGSRGKYRVNPIRADLYSGSLDADASFDLTGQAPRTKLTASLAGINLGALLTDVSGKAAIRGSAKTAFTISAAGAEGPQILNTLNGSGNFLVTNGDFPLASDLPKKLEIEQTGALNQVKSATSQTSFTELKGSFAIKDGVVSNNDLFLAMRMAEVKGRGDVNLPAQQIDYLATMDLLSASVLPIRIRGPLKDPSIFVDPIELVRLSAQGVQTLITAPMDAVQALTNGSIPGSETLGGVGETGKKVLEGILGGGSSTDSGSDSGSKSEGQSIEQGIGNALDSIFGGSKK
ncbi:AsmA family protein [Oceanidesulfovibrio marinus]|uniref:AsmA family protein n=1 Tax=Oceanidesulfovibrio marinus TaxID=370038 RepID=A0ABX6NL10_9BACT|nr:AsmA family protein [Oceanidesulfovibrio marinus]QJT10896.1 AsmA family protein [Oceanidesulfovibrio marinus]